MSWKSTLLFLLGTSRTWLVFSLCQFWRSITLVQRAWKSKSRSIPHLKCPFRHVASHIGSSSRKQRFASYLLNKQTQPFLLGATMIWQGHTGWDQALKTVFEPPGWSVRCWPLNPVAASTSVAFSVERPAQTVTTPLSSAAPCFPFKLRCAFCLSDPQRPHYWDCLALKLFWSPTWNERIYRARWPPIPEPILSLSAVPGPEH